ncbi:hypothetical protein KY348_00720, partial [Candidatus Woesearchaeota archaeon]|nr:hypothetical protein [Candidatus Woesearchaeota archaeon]
CADGKVCNGGVCVVPGSCVPDWSCSDWTDCRVDGTRVRFCFDKKGCGSVVGKPAVSESCVYGEDAGVDTDVGGGVDTDVGDGAGNVSEEGFDEGEGGVGGGFPLGSIVLIMIIVGLGFFAFIFKGQIASLFQGSSKRPGLGPGAGPGMGLGAGPSGPGSGGLSPRELSAYNYIKMNLDRGYSPMQIRQTLMNAGWSHEELDKLFRRFP